MKVKILIRAPNNKDIEEDYKYHIDFELEHLEYYETEAAKGNDFAKFAIERAFYKAVRKVKSRILPEFDYYFFSPYITLGKLYTEVIYSNLPKFFTDYPNVYIDLKPVNYHIKWWGYINQKNELEVIQYEKHKVEAIKKAKLPLKEFGIISKKTKKEAFESFSKRFETTQDS